MIRIETSKTGFMIFLQKHGVHVGIISYEATVKKLQLAIAFSNYDQDPSCLIIAITPRQANALIDGFYGSN